MGKRDWSEYPGRIVKAYTGGVSAAGFAITGVILAVGAIPAFPLATPFFIVGSLLGTGSILAGLLKAIPPQYREAAKLVGKYESLDNLKDIYPPLFKVGIVGLSSAGKTTLIRKFCRIPEKNLELGKTKGTTQKLYVYIAALNIPNSNDENAKPQYLAFIDSPGEEEPNQLEVAEAADFLCLVIDHNQCLDSDKDKHYQIDNSRLEEHNRFVKNVCLYLKNKRRENPISYVHFLLNKRDIWEKNNSSDIVNLKGWFQEKVRDWKTAIFVKDNNLSNNYHSNDSADDISKFEEILMNALKKS